MIDLDNKQPAADAAGSTMTRRRFVGYLIAAPTVIAAAELFPTDAQALPTVQPTDVYDLSDLLNNAAAPTSNLIRIIVNTDGTVSFALPRAEVGQGITTAVAVTIADEMDLSVDKVRVTLADARPELVWNQLTGGSNTMHSIFYPVRVAAATARGQLLKVAAALFGETLQNLTIIDGVVSSLTSGRSIPFSRLSELAAVQQNAAVNPVLKPISKLTLVGTPQKRIDAKAIVTGAKVFAMDLVVPGAMPAMICRPPTIGGTALAINNLAAVLALPGVLNVAIVAKTKYVGGGVAVCAQTFGQCIDAIRALNVTWGPGPVDGKSEADVLAELKAKELPMTPALLGKTIDETFTFYFRPGEPLEPNCAVADVRADGAEVWSSLKSPIYAKQEIAKMLGLPGEKVTAHVTEGGGSFGRHLFADGAFEAATVSKLFGRPVRLMWHRTDGYRQGRAHPMNTSRVRMTYLGNNVLAYDQRHTSVATDFTHGLGEILTATGATLTPQANSLSFSQTVFELTQSVPYNVGPVTQLLNEAYAYNTFPTSSVRNIYSPDVAVARELMMDRMAAIMGKDPYQFRKALVRDARMAAVLDKVASAAGWGKPMAPGTAQGIALHSEYKGRAACIVEIDCTPATVQRQIPNAYTGPRVTRVTYVVDVGLPINPLGLQAQMMGGIMDGIANALTFSLHLQNGRFIESSWDNAYYTRQWNVPPALEVIVMPQTTDVPGGAGEFGVAATMAAVACAYARATGTTPTRFPINHDLPLTFTPTSAVPPIPQSPTDGLAKAY